ncbi:MAG TPA: HIT family protein [Jiangellaceae bacterium]|jgi:diadenosine tetraphosphate (Ap4A) HIT family hydrolase|nr:HIT family protein [Jiangellaceae bacterium]
MRDQTCPLCRGREVDPDMGREQVWEDAHWRLTTSIGPGDPTPGFSYLEPKRHIPSIADLDGGEAVTFGLAIARSTKALKQATGSEAVYVYVFGGHIPHLHVHLAPHREGDALNSAMLKGEIVEEPLPTGAVSLVSKDFPAIDQVELRSVADRVRRLLS